MKIKFIKEYVSVDPATNSGIIHRFGEIEEIQDYTAEWLIDSGFAIKVKEPKWIRKQIKLVRFDKPDGKHTSGSIFVRVNFVFIKTFYFEDSEYSVSSIKEGEDDYIEFTTNENDAPTWDKWHQDNVNYINQLVRDGYIEIQDNPNIVWEDEKCD